MTTLNDFSVTDGNQYVLAAYYNLLLGSILRKEFSNAVTMSGDLELTDGDTAIQRLDCNGANRVVKVPVGANGNHPFLVINTTSVGSWTLTVKSNDAVTTHQVLDPGEVAFVLPDGNGGYYALTAFGVTNGDAHDHSGGDGSQIDHGGLAGLADDDHSQYLLATGLREWTEQGADPSTPGANKWKLYFKSGGLYLIDDLGAVTGPLVGIGGGGSNSVCDGRLTLLSANPIPTTDQTAKTTVYFTPYVGNKIALYDGAATWNIRTFTELSVSVPATTNTPFDIFCYDNAGTPTLETVNWTSDTARATALVYQDGVLVKSGATTRRYLGTGRTTGSSGQCEDSQVKRFLWNYYNRRPRTLHVEESTGHNYNVATFRAWNNNQANADFEYVVGYVEDSIAILLTAQGARISTDGNPTISFGVNSTTAAYGVYGWALTVLGRVRGGSSASVIPILGYSYACVIEFSSVGTAPGATFEAATLDGVIQC